MINQSEIVGSPVVIVSEGACVGYVSQITVNQKGSGVAGLAIYEQGKDPDDPNLFVEIDKINAIGSFAVTVNDSSCIRDIKPEDLRTLSSGGNSVKVLTTMGEAAGEVVDFKLDLETMGFGSILLKKVNNSGESEYFEADADAVVTYGRDFTIVQHDKLKSIDIADDAYPVSGNVSSGAASSASNESSAAAPEPAADDAGAEAEPVDKRKEEMVKQYSDMLVGRALAKEVTKPDGGIVALKGTVITEDLINTVYDISPNMLEILALFAK